MNHEQMKQNVFLLQTTLQTLQSLIAEKQKNPKALYYYEAFTLASAAKIVYRRLEQELRQVGGRIVTPAPELPETPEEVRRNPEGIKESDFWQTCWGQLNQKKQ